MDDTTQLSSASSRLRQTVLHLTPSISPKIILGTGSVGDASDPIAKFNTPEATQEYLNLFRNYGHTTIDTARGYSAHAPGSCEPLLGQTDCRDWASIDTKITPIPKRNHRREKIPKEIEKSLSALKVLKVHIEFLHGPDRYTPFEETCAAMNEAYLAGKFSKFGLSNFRPDEVEEIIQICEKNGWVKPTVYQGLYNAISRTVENELLPILRKHQIAFYAYSPGAGGMFSGNFTLPSTPSDSSRSTSTSTTTTTSTDPASLIPLKQGTRGDQATFIGTMHSTMYHHAPLIAAAHRVYTAAQTYHITAHSVALRWLLHHSHLDGARGDGIIIGASSLHQLLQNLEACRAGPLPPEVVGVVEGVWDVAKGSAPKPWA